MARRYRPPNDDGQAALRTLSRERLTTELRLAITRADDISREIARRVAGPVKPKGVDPRTLIYGSPDWKAFNERA